MNFSTVTAILDGYYREKSIHLSLKHVLTPAALMKKARIDELLMERGICGSTDEAARLVMAGKIRTGPDSVVKKASLAIDADTPLFADDAFEYVSRGAYKLVTALDRHLPSLKNMTTLDIGASTGGFTDLMLKRGAVKVYSADVGKGLLHWKLRSDPRVICIESLNAREISESHVPEKVDILTMDVSFISVTKILPAADRLLKPGAFAFILVKPQFEARREDVPPGGVVTDPAVRLAAVEKVRSFAVSETGWGFVESIESPIKGPKGNQEFVAVFRKLKEHTD